MNENPVCRSREDYLTEAVNEMRPLFSELGKDLPKIKISVGFPARGALSKKKRVIGECWFPSATTDGSHQIFISPLLDSVIDPGGVFPTVVHEVAHSVAGLDAKHGPKFRKVAEGVGLEGKMTATVAGEELLEKLSKIHEKLGPYPHAKLDPTLTISKKQGTRLIKCECQIGDCGYTVRTTKKWLEIGAPHCPIHGAMHFDNPEEE